MDHQELAEKMLKSLGSFVADTYGKNSDHYKGYEDKTASQLEFDSLDIVEAIMCVEDDLNIDLTVTEDLDEKIAKMTMRQACEHAAKDERVHSQLK